MNMEALFKCKVRLVAYVKHMVLQLIHSYCDSICLMGRCYSHQVALKQESNWETVTERHVTVMFFNTSFWKLLPPQINLCTPSLCGGHSTCICSCSYLKSQQIKPKHSARLIPRGRLENTFLQFQWILNQALFVVVMLWLNNINNCWSNKSQSFLWVFIVS